MNINTTKEVMVVSLGRDTTKSLVFASRDDRGPLQSAKRELLYNILNNNDRKLIIMDSKGGI